MSESPQFSYSSGLPYEVKMIMKSNWMVGYHPEKDEMFLYFVDQDGLCWVFRRSGLDLLCFYEFTNFSSAELLGEL